MKKVVLTGITLLFLVFAIAQTKTEIKPADLSKGLSAYITKNFPGYGVEKAFKVVNKGVISTEVMVSKGAEKLELTFDKEFKLTKKEAIKPDLKMPPAKEEKKPLPPIKK